jgi:hypothetical protein
MSKGRPGGSKDEGPLRRFDMAKMTSFSLVALGLICVFLAQPVRAKGEEPPAYLHDRGTGLPTSMFGTYIRGGELLVFPFLEYSLDHNREYQPSQLGFGLERDFRGKCRDTRGQVFIAYGVTDWLAVEFEAATMSAILKKSPDDPSLMPSKISESGIGDIEGQLRLRLVREGDRRPEVFGYLEVTAPSNKDKVLIGNADWDFKPGIGVVKGFSWGTMTFRATVEYNREGKHLDIGEISLEYLKRLSSSWSVFAAFEGGETGAPDEWELVTGVQWRVADFLILKLDNSLGLFSKSNDWALQVGGLISIFGSGKTHD